MPLAGGELELRVGRDSFCLPPHATKSRSLAAMRFGMTTFSPMTPQTESSLARWAVG